MWLVSEGEVGAAVKNGDLCEVIAGTHKGKRGTAEDWKLSKTGHATITVRMASGDRGKTLARNVRVIDMAAKLARIDAIIAYTSVAMRGGPGSADIDALLYDEMGLPK